jgi:1-acyl-sn-glycerol-3-phosphate acyltransferase
MSAQGYRLDEGAGVRWRRRALTMTGVFGLTLATWLLFPALLLGAVAVDLVRRRCFAVTRLLVFGLVYLSCEVLGLLASLLIWIATGPWRGGDTERFQRWNFRLEVLWASALFAAARAIFGFRVSSEGEEGLGPGPALVFVRHASIADALLPAVFLSRRHGWRLRYVLKRELLWDPCLDVAGQRLPNVFVLRGSGQSEREIAAIRALATGLGPREGVLIYPEGTRASPEKRRRALDRVATSGDEARLARARALRHLLPPRSGGPLALLEAAAGADVIFAAHVGFDGIVSLRDLLSGALVGRRIEVGFWRARAQEVPTGSEARMAWLDAHWAVMDEWVAKRLWAPSAAAV